MAGQQVRAAGRSHSFAAAVLLGCSLPLLLMLMLSAAPADDQEESAAGWTSVELAGWPCAVGIPLWGGLDYAVQQPEDLVLDQDNMADDLFWSDADDQRGSNQPFQIVAWSMRQSIPQLQATNWIYALKGANAEFEKSAQLLSSSARHHYGGTRWIRIDFKLLEADDAEGRFHNCLLFTLTPAGGFYVQLSFDDASPAAIEAGIEACLGRAGV